MSWDDFEWLESAGSTIPRMQRWPPPHMDWARKCDRCTKYRLMKGVWFRQGTEPICAACCDELEALIALESFGKFMEKPVWRR